MVPSPEILFVAKRGSGPGRENILMRCGWGEPHRVKVRGRSWGARALLVLEKCRELAQLSQGRHV